jgi:hypothetical protein
MWLYAEPHSTYTVNSKSLYPGYRAQHLHPTVFRSAHDHLPARSAERRTSSNEKMSLLSPTQCYQVQADRISLFVACERHLSQTVTLISLRLNVTAGKVLHSLGCF